MERRLGFRNIRPLLDDIGQERFGVLSPAGGGEAAVLRLFGRDLALADPRALHDTLDALTAALPERPVQFLLSRRRPSPAAIATPFQAAIAARFAEQPAVAAAVWADLRDRQMPALAAAGLADLWAGVAVAAPDSAALAYDLAELYVRLPFESAPLRARDLRGLVQRLFQPGPPPPLPPDRPVAAGLSPDDWDDLAPERLLIGEDGIALAPDSRTLYWYLQPPLPEAPGGWIWQLLEFPDLRDLAWDVAVHLRPTRATAQLRRVLEERLERIAAELAPLGAAPTARPPPDAPWAASAAWRLALERQEVEDRLDRLVTGRERLRDATVLLALHTRPPVGAREDWAAVLAAAGLTARPIRGRRALSQVLPALLPLAAAEGLRSFPAAGAQAATLALLPTAPPGGASDWPILGLARDGSPFRLLPEADDLPGHRLITGGTDEERRRVAARWALGVYRAGVDLLILDPAGQWSDFVAALGGRIVRPGADGEAGRLPLLAVPLVALTRPSEFASWSRELGELIAALVTPRTGQPPEVVEGQVAGALLQLGRRALDREAPDLLTLDTLQAELRRGGYTVTAGAVAALAGRPVGGLFAPGAPPAGAGLWCIGPAAPDLPPRAAALALAIAFRRALAFGAAGGWRTAIADSLPSALAHASLARDLADLLRGEGVDRTALWALIGAPELRAVLAGPHADLVTALPLAVFLAAGAGGASLLAGAAQALGVPAPACAQIGVLATDQALICQDGVCTLLTVPPGPALPGRPPDPPGAPAPPRPAY